MRMFTCIIPAIILCSVFSSCSGQAGTNIGNTQNNTSAQSKEVGGGCDGCELMYVGMPNHISPVDTSAGWQQDGQRLLVTGTVYKLDGKTPAPGVIIYYWQTDSKGYYTATQDMDARAKRHGHIRGWIKTGENGKYALYTIRPAAYPGQDMPAHIHISIKEPEIANEYYIDEFVFDDDKLLTGKKRKALENRGGSGVLRVLIKDDLQVAEHNIITGLNIPGYPVKSSTSLSSGLQIGEDNPSFTPYHAYGADKGTRTCPVCKYGRYHGIVYFVGNQPNWVEIKKWLAYLDRESINREKYLKAYFVYGNDKDFDKQQRQQALEKIGKELNLQKVALTYVPSMSDTESEVHLNKINPAAENTFIVFKQSNIVGKFINLKPTAENFMLVSATLDSTQGAYFNLPTPFQH